MDLKTKIRNSIYGFAVGDAYGVPHEFSSRSFSKTKGMIGFRAHNQPIGTWSDDTSLTLATLDMLSDDYVSINDLKRNFKDFYHNGKYTVDGALFDIGYQTKCAIDSNFDLSKIEIKDGNGSLMRMLPVAFYLCAVDTHAVKAKEIIKTISSITHPSLIAIKCCEVYAELVADLLNDCDKGYVLSQAIKNMPELNLDKSILELKSDGYVFNTLETALWIFDNCNSYAQSMHRVVCLGGDTDTIGAIVGSLMGLYYGNIPKKMLNLLRGMDAIDLYLDKFISKVCA